MKKLLTLFFAFGLFITISGQTNGGCVNPDSLTEITVSGTTLIDDSYQHPIYYLDVDGDGIEDYHLNFGPFWYEPDSSEAVRPLAGEQITINGGVGTCDSLRDVSTIIVYEINGEFWRDPYYAYWNDFDGKGGGFHFGGNQGDCGGYAFGWRHDSLEIVTLSGIALVDTTFYMSHYYLDADNDTIPDYFLNFGPWWYEPASGAVRPQNGETVTIEGGLIEGLNYDVVVVYSINGLEWRDSSYFGTNIGGGWIFTEMTQSRSFNNPYDEEDFFTVQPGWRHGNMMSDSLYCQMLELYPNNIPNAQNQNAFMGFEFAAFGSNGFNNMCGAFGGKMGLNNSAQFQFHYNNIQVEGNEIDESSLTVEYWDEQTSAWVEVEGVTVNTETNTISFASNDLPQYVIVTADKITSVNAEKTDELSNTFSLKQNYPNPFNPTTTIEFTVVKENPVELNVYDILGRKIQTLVNKSMGAGTYSYQFDASNLASGIYFYQLKVGSSSSVKKMNLMK